MTCRAALTPFFLILFFACQPPKNDGQVSEIQFDVEHSDPAAVELADSVLEASGGKLVWDKVQSLTWNSARGEFAWDKQNDRLRFKPTSSNKQYLINLKTQEGRVRVNNEELAQAEEVKSEISLALKEWQRESYELALPFLLKSPGATLEYLGEDTLHTGEKCNLLQLIVNHETTTKVKYVACVDLDDNLIKKISFFPSLEHEVAAYTQQWDNYKSYGSLTMSADRTDGSGPRRLILNESIDEKVFTEF